MSFSENIRVKTEQKYKTLYNELKNFAVGDMHELFFLCACLGFKANQKEPFERGDDRFWSRTFTPEEYACFYAMILEKKNMDLASIKDDKTVLGEIELYANAGMKILIDELLSDYVHETNEEYKLDSTCRDELPKALLYFIYEQLQ